MSIALFGHLYARAKMTQKIISKSKRSKTIEKSISIAIIYIKSQTIYSSIYKVKKTIAKDLHNSPYQYNLREHQHYSVYSQQLLILHFKNTNPHLIFVLKCLNSHPKIDIQSLHPMIKYITYD